MSLFFSSELVAQEDYYKDSVYYYNDKGKIDVAIFWNAKRIKKNREKYGLIDSFYAISISDQALFYRKKGMYQEAETLFLESKSIIEKIFGRQSVHFADVISNIASLYKNLNKFSPAEKLMLEAISIYENLEIKAPSNYSIALSNLANLYASTGNDFASEPLQFKAIELRKKIYGDTSTQYAVSLNNLAKLYHQMNNYTASETNYRNALAVFEKKNDVANSDYTQVMQNLGTLFITTRNFAAADSLLNKSLNIQKVILGENDIRYALTLNELGVVNMQRDNFTKAEEYLKKALAIKQGILVSSIDNSSTLNSLGSLYFKMGDYKKAEANHLHALNLIEKLIGKTNSEYVNYIRNLAGVYKTIRQDTLAASYYILVLEIEKQLLLDKLNFMSETELSSYTNRNSLSLLSSLSLLLQYQSPDLLRAAYDNRLLFSGVAIQNTTSLGIQMLQSQDTSLVSLWQSYLRCKILLSRLLAAPIASRSFNTDSLGIIVNQKEKLLIRNSSAYRNMNKRLNVTWKDVRNHLQANEAAMEFVKFNYSLEKNRNKQASYYAALLIRPQDTSPIFIKLFEESQLQLALKNFAFTAYKENSGSKKAPPSKANIYNILWQPLEPYLKQNTTIYFAPDGLLHQVAFAAIPTSKNVLLCDKYNLIQVTSTRQVALKENNELAAPTSITLFGGINYNRQSNDTGIVATPDPYSYAYQQNRGAALDSFSYLPNTLVEVDGIKKDMELKQKGATLFTGDRATEAAFRSVAGAASPAVIHFATHGFTLPVTTNQTGSSNTFKISDNPLLRSGLVMAGGNKGWNNKAAADEDDGILTALEIASVPLPNTQLAVLSACETGIGELRGSEGVFGLQRAFKLAGVNYVMASLWQVPDAATKEFMQTFYTNWLGGNTIRKAFINTQQIMRKKHSPYSWAAFTLVQ